MYLKEKLDKMKRAIILLVVSICLFMTGCSNEFAQREYDSVEKISQKEDHYAKENSVFNSIEGGYALTVSKFDGNETLWSTILEEDQNMAIDFSFCLSAGQAKLVHIVILSILVYTFSSRMFDLMQPPAVKHSIAVV